MARIFSSLCIAAACLVATGTLANGFEAVNRSSTVAVGSTFVRTVQDSGSYGNGTTTISANRAPDREWKGQTVGVWKYSQGPDLLFRPADGAFVAFANGEQPVTSYEPANGWQWPLKVGNSWTRKVMMTLHNSNQTVPVETLIHVEAYEDVATPAGTFKALRVHTVDTLGNDDLQWFQPDLTVFIKQKLTRTARHPAGPGVRETELVSQDIRHQ